MQGTCNYLRIGELEINNSTFKSKPKYKVLFVDDSEDILATVERMFFKEEHLEIITATSPESALKLISSTDLDLIVTDIKMPGMHGLEMIEEIRKKDPDIPIIIFTAFRGMKEDGIVRLYNIEEYYIKPIDWNHLFKKVKQLSASVKNRGKGKEKSLNEINIYDRIVKDCKDKEEEMSKIIDPHCPGDDPAKKRFPESFECPKCGEEVEIWSDEESGRCSGCKEVIHRKDIKRSS